MDQLGLKSLNLVYGTHKMASGLKYGVMCDAIDTATAYDNADEIRNAIDRVTDHPPIIITKFNTKDFETGIDKAVEQHLSKLGRKPDVVLLHATFGDNNKNLDALVSLKTLFPTSIVGVSNFSVDEIKYLVELGGLRPQVVQLEYHPFFQPNYLVQYCHENDIVVMAYRPFGQGAILADPKIKSIAEKLCATPAQIILKWLKNKDILPVFSSNSLTNIVTNCQYDNVSLRYLDTMELNGMNIGPNGSTCMTKYCNNVY